ncbi:MAG: hypothetical protein JWN07_3394 [Hyphomicrobiales bacterium]|nr:hypothetical protein [Hyphomicrobiales bacterium]
MAYSDSPRDDGRPRWGEDNGAWRSARRCGPGAWRPMEIAAMVVGFMVFWPIGLAILGFKVWQKQTGYQGSMTSAVRQGWSYAENRAGAFGFGRNRSAETSGFRGFGGFGGFGGGTGNSAFDDWRTAELKRLEEEHRKLEAAEREFADFLRNLRQAKDREEFDRFMRDRGGNSGQTNA